MNTAPRPPDPDEAPPTIPPVHTPEDTEGEESAEGAHCAWCGAEFPDADHVCETADTG